MLHNISIYSREDTTLQLPSNISKGTSLVLLLYQFINEHVLFSGKKVDLEVWNQSAMTI